MPLDKLKKLDSKFTKLKYLFYFLGICTELVLVFAIACAWNYVFSKQLNVFLFQEESLAYSKAFLIYFSLQFLVIKNKQYFQQQ